MNRPGPSVVLSFTQRGQEVAATRETTRPTNGPIVRALARPVSKRQKRDRAVRFFQDIHGYVHQAPQCAPHLVACANGRGVAADQMVR